MVGEQEAPSSPGTEAVSDWAWLEAAKEVDALTPGSPPLVAPNVPAYQPCRLVLPRGWRYDTHADVYVDPRGERIGSEFIRATGDPQRWFAQQAADLADSLDMAARAARESR